MQMTVFTLLIYLSTHFVAERIAREEREKYYAKKNVLQSDEEGIEETSPAPGIQPPIDGNSYIIIIILIMLSLIRRVKCIFSFHGRRVGNVLLTSIP